MNAQYRCLDNEQLSAVPVPQPAKDNHHSGQFPRYTSLDQYQLDIRDFNRIYQHTGMLGTTLFNGLLAAKIGELVADNMTTYKPCLFGYLSQDISGVKFLTGGSFDADLYFNEYREEYTQLIAGKDLYVIPLGYGGHWTIAIVEKQAERVIVEFYDSQPRVVKPAPKAGDDCFPLNESEVVEEPKIWNNVMKFIQKLFPRNVVKVVVSDLPYQTDGKSCGVWCIFFAEWVMKQDPIIKTVHTQEFLDSSFWPTLLVIVRQEVDYRDAPHSICFTKDISEVNLYAEIEMVGVIIHPNPVLDIVTIEDDEVVVVEPIDDNDVPITHNEKVSFEPSPMFRDITNSPEYIISDSNDGEMSDTDMTEPVSGNLSNRAVIGVSNIGRTNLEGKLNFTDSQKLIESGETRRFLGKDLQNYDHTYNNHAGTWQGCLSFIEITWKINGGISTKLTDDVKAVLLTDMDKSVDLFVDWFNNSRISLELVSRYMFHWTKAGYKYIFAQINLRRGVKMVNPLQVMKNQAERKRAYKRKKLRRLQHGIQIPLPN